MPWKESLNGDPLPWLLDPASPGVRYLAMRDLLDLPADDPQLLQARRAAHQEGHIPAILARMDPAGFWEKAGAGYGPKYRSTVWSLLLLAQLGAACQEDERITRACGYYLDHAFSPGGYLSYNGTPSGTIDCLQGNMCWALLELGCQDPRLETAFEWLARSVTGEGVAPTTDKKAPLRFHAYKCGPNFACGANYRLPCAWGAVKVMLAFSRLPAGARTPLIERAIQAGLDFLLSVDPASAAYPSISGKPSESWFKFGFPVFYVTDILQLAEVLARFGLGRDPRLANLLEVITRQQDSQGRWPLKYDYRGKTWGEFGSKRNPSPWVTLRAVRLLKIASA